MKILLVYTDRRGRGQKTKFGFPIFSDFSVHLGTLPSSIPSLPFLFPHSLSFHYLKKSFGDETSNPLSQSKKTKKN